MTHFLSLIFSRLWPRIGRKMIFLTEKLTSSRFCLGSKNKRLRRKKFSLDQWCIIEWGLKVEKKQKKKREAFFSWKWLSWGRRWAWFRTGFETVLLFLARIKKSVHVRAWVCVSAWVCARVSECASQWTEEISATDFINDPLLKVSPCRKKKKWAR